MDTLVSWKKRRDKYSDSDSVEGVGDSIDDFSEQGNVEFVQSSKQINFIKKDETNAEAMRKLKIKKWW